MNDNLTTNASNEAESPAFLVGAVSGSCSFLSKPNRIRYNNRAHEFLSGRNTITANILSTQQSFVYPADVWDIAPMCCYKLSCLISKNLI